MGTPQDAATLNGSSLDAKYFYGVSSTSVSSSGINGTNTYTGSVAGFSATTLSGTITNTSTNGNGSFSLTAANGSVTNYFVLGSSSDSQNLVFQAYNPSTGATTGQTYLLSDSGTAPSGSVSFNSNNGYLKPTCFLAGTMILTPTGERAVEEFEVGDIVLNAERKACPIIWVGRRDYDRETYIQPNRIFPVLVRKDALSDNVPSRDTFLSDGHALVFEDAEKIMVAVHELINGSTIQRVEADRVSYWHIELSSHDVIIANGIPAETFLNVDNRGSFQTVDVVADFNKSASSIELSKFPRCGNDEVTRRLRERLSERASNLVGVAALAFAA